MRGLVILVSFTEAADEMLYHISAVGKKYCPKMARLRGVLGGGGECWLLNYGQKLEPKELQWLQENIVPLYQGDSREQGRLGKSPS